MSDSSPETNPPQTQEKTNPPWRMGRYKLYFNGSKVVRVVVVLSSGNGERDRQCIEWCKTQTIPYPKKGVRTNAQWLILDIKADAVLRSPPAA
ncbi:MAG: hypothetical protein LBG66_02195 [Gallionellaceae bacterium]|jgi:hypothetical protein|nr:hypothetical protein [Gallionellaceae bacterium]